VNSKSRKLLIYLVAGAGFEPATLGYEETKTLLNQQLKEIDHNAKPL
jgi:hypothetical protein